MLGGTPRRLGVEGEQLAGVHTLRTPEDAATIHSEANGKKVVIVGGSFIGMEVSYIYALMHDYANIDTGYFIKWVLTKKIYSVIVVISCLNN